MSTEISAVICTRNQSDYLWKSIDSLVRQTLSKEKYEIIIVDNGSTDSTKEVIKNFAGFEKLHYIHEPIVGLSQARNTGWQNASGEYVAYLDDDAIASTNWLERIYNRFKTLEPRPVCIGGRIMPIWELNRPEWLTKELETYVGIIDWTDTLMFLKDDSFYLAGSNVCYQRRVLQESKGFNTSLGRKGDTLLSNEEILMQRYLMSRDFPICYDPEILVQHHVKAKCLKERWFYKRYFWQGVSNVILEYQISIAERHTWHFLSHFLLDVSHLIFSSAKYAGTKFTKSNKRVSTKCWNHHWRGRICTNIRIAFGHL